MATFIGKEWKRKPPTALNGHIFANKLLVRRKEECDNDDENNIHNEHNYYDEDDDDNDGEHSYFLRHSSWTSSCNAISANLWRNPTRRAGKCWRR